MSIQYESYSSNDEGHEGHWAGIADPKMRNLHIQSLLLTQVVGIHILGPNAGEIIQGLAVAIRCGVTKEHFDDCAAWSR